MTNELCWLSAVELAAAIREKTISPVDAVDAVLDQIERLDPELNAFCTVTADAAREAARAAANAVVAGDWELGPLHGVPISIKDMILTKGVRTTFGSKLNADFVPTESAPTVERLEAAGAISVGKTNTPDHGWLGLRTTRCSGRRGIRGTWSARQAARAAARVQPSSRAWGRSRLGPTPAARFAFLLRYPAFSRSRPTLGGFRSIRSARPGVFRTQDP